MTQVCNECGRNLYNPFYDVGLAIVYGPKRIFVSAETATMCVPHFEKLKPELSSKLSEIKIGFVVDELSGTCGGLTGAIQWSYGFERKKDFKFMNLDAGIMLLPNSAHYLFNQYLSGQIEFDEFSEGNLKKSNLGNKVAKKFEELIGQKMINLPQPKPAMNEIYIAPEVEDAMKKEGRSIDDEIEKMARAGANLRIIREIR